MLDRCEAFITRSYISFAFLFSPQPDLPNFLLLVTLLIRVEIYKRSSVSISLLDLDVLDYQAKL